MSKEKQIEEMANIIDKHTTFDTMWEESMESAEALYNAGYRKQSEGKWIGKGMAHCSECGNVVNFRNVSRWLYNFCPNCGAKMKQN